MVIRLVYVHLSFSSSLQYDQQTGAKTATG
jgi:hypothetical protein